MNQNIVFVLIHGFGASKINWSREYVGTHKLKYHNFLAELKKLGAVYRVGESLKHFNIDYYDLNKDPVTRESWDKIYRVYKPHGKNIMFKLKDLDYDQICSNIYKKVRSLYPTQRLIPVGHSYGGGLVYQFSKMYSSECLFAVMLDGVPISKECAQNSYDKFESKNEETVKKYLATDQQLYRVLKKIKTMTMINLETDTESFDTIKLMIRWVYDLIALNSTLYRIKNVNSTLHVPTMFFKSIRIKASDLESKKDNCDCYCDPWNQWILKEKKDVEEHNDSSLYSFTYFANIDHFLWWDQGTSDKIINDIKDKIDSLKIRTFDPMNGSMKRIFLIRHGETEYNRQHISQGRELDPPLNDTGRAQADKTGLYLKAHHDPDSLIMCSSQQRATETAGLINHHLNTKIIFSDDLVEFGKGKLSGITKSDPIFLKVHDAMKTYHSLHRDPIERNILGSEGEARFLEKTLHGLDLGVETYDEGLPRIRRAIQNIISSRFSTVYVVSHGDFLESMIKMMMGTNVTILGDMGHGKNCWISLIEYISISVPDSSEGYFRLVTAPNTEHLGPGLLRDS